MIFLSKHHCIIIHSSFGKDTVFLGEISRKGNKLTRIENDPAAFILELEKGNEVSNLLKLIIYVRSLLANERLHEFLTEHQQEVLASFQEIIESCEE